MQKLKGQEAEVKWQLIIVSLTRTSAVADRPRVLRVVDNIVVTQMSFEVIRI